MFKYTILFVFSFFQIVSAMDNFIFYSSEETENLIRKTILKKEKGAYLRTGDGDVNLAIGKSSGSHKVNANISKEMKDVFKLEGPNIIKTLPYHDGKNEYKLHPLMNAKFVKQMFVEAKKIWGNDLNVYSAGFLGQYLTSTNSEKCLSFLKFLRNSNCSLVIGNENIPAQTKNLLFGEQCFHVKTPQKNPYNYIDATEEESLKKIKSLDPKKFHVIILALGNTGRVLVKRIYNKVGNNVYFFDFGSSIDALSNLKTRSWIRLYFNYEQFMPKLIKYLNT